MRVLVNHRYLLKKIEDYGLGVSCVLELFELGPNLGNIIEEPRIVDEVQVDIFQPELRAVNEQRKGQILTEHTLSKLACMPSGAVPIPEYFVVINRSERASPLSLMAAPTYSSVP